MKHVNIRTAFLVVNLSFGLVFYGIMFMGLKFWGPTEFSCTHLAFIGGGALVLLSLLNVGLISRWILRPLIDLQHLVQTPLTQELPPISPAVLRITEFVRCDQELRINLNALQKWIQIGQAFAATGEYPNISRAHDRHALGQMMQEILRLFQTVQTHVEDLERGNLFLDIPERLEGTPLGEALQNMTTAYRNTVSKIGKEAKNVSLSSARFASMSHQGSRNADRETEAIESISSSSAQLAENLRGVMHNIKRQSDSLENTFTDIEHMVDSIQNITGNVEMLSASIDATSQSINAIHRFMQEINAHAHSLSQISATISTEANDGAVAVNEVIDGIQTIKRTVEEAAVAIHHLGRESQRIGEILEVINSVAEQTNLLSLNASIIAAQAGKYGRGFAVVAGEIRELADRTRTSTKEISKIIQSLQTEVAHGTSAMKNCLDAVKKGVGLANVSGATLQKIVQSIQGARQMAGTLADATVTQTKNSQQVTMATEQIGQKLGILHETATAQGKDSGHLAEMANILKNVTQQIEQSAGIQLEQTECIVQAIQSIRELLLRNADITYDLASSSDELGALESHLAGNIGQFIVTRYPLPAGFDLARPTIACIYPSKVNFFDYIHAGGKKFWDTHGYQTLEFHVQENPVVQVEYINWLMQQPWLKGIVLGPIDEFIGGHIVTNVQNHKVPLVIIDRYAKHAPVTTILSHNFQGGEFGAELLHNALPDHSTVLVCGSRHVHSIFNRVEGFFKKASSYKTLRVLEVFVSSIDRQQSKHSILEGVSMIEDNGGIFVTNEDASNAYLDLLDGGEIPRGKLAAVCYDLSPRIAKAITDGSLVGTIFQDPTEIGKVAAQELFGILKHSKESTKLKEILVPVKAVTRDNLATFKVS